MKQEADATYPPWDTWVSFAERFAAIGAMVFFIGLGHVLSAMLVASPPLNLRWHIPSPSEINIPLPPREQVPGLTRDLAEPPTIPLEDARSSPPSS